jgi:tetratricopeptide (TPR) repeat protein
MKKLLLNPLICLALSCTIQTHVFSQENTDPKNLFVEAESYFLFEEYDEALPLYQRILRLEPENYNVTYKIGICYLNNIYQQSRSIDYLAKATAHINPKFRENNYKEKLAPPEAHYYLGRAYHVNNKLDEAIGSYKLFAKIADPAAYDLDLVADDIKACETAKILFNTPVYFHPVNIGEPVNTRFEELNPVISGDGNTLAFTRKLQFYDGVFITKRTTGGKWSEPYNLTPDFALDGNSYTTGISYDGDEIFVYRSDEFDGNIYSGRRVNGKWQALQKLNNYINTKYWESHASPSPDGQYLYFTSNRDGGYGGLDIYRSKRGANKEWGPAINLGPVINTPENEETPFLANEGYTLFFSSQGHKTIGDYDIFVANLRSDGTWSKPVNMGIPLNTTGSNRFYAPLGVNAFGMVAFYDEENTHGLLDIYTVEIYNEAIPRTFTISGKLDLSQAGAKNYNKIKVLLYDAATGELKTSTTVSEDGSYSLKTTQGDYNLVIEGPEIESQQKHITLNVNSDENQLILPVIALSSPVLTPGQQVAQTVSRREKITVKNDFYAVDDSSAIPIELILPRKAELQVDILLGDTLFNTENISVERRRFTYFYKPKQGENILRFTASDEEGNEYETTVTVTYYPPLDDVEITGVTAEMISPSLQGSYIGWVASVELLDYLQSISLEDFEDYYSLYDHLNENSVKVGYTREDINEMFAILFTQRDLAGFAREFSEVFQDTTGLLDNLVSATRIPIEYLQALRDQKILTAAELDTALFRLLYQRYHAEDLLYQKLSLFSDTKNGFVMSGGTSPAISEKLWNDFKTGNSEEASHIMQLTATTSDLDFFYQNMLLASGSDLKKYLNTLNFDSLYINTSIDLVSHLFGAEPIEDYSIEDLIKAMELASNQGHHYLSKFRDALAEHATGNLKAELMEIRNKESGPNTYTGLINYLVDRAEFRGYSRENVYSLLLDLIEIKDVNEFAEKLRSYNKATINAALAEASLQNFSNPLELIQYLVSVSERFDFTESDINNLLIRMILEQGILDSVSDMKDVVSDNLWKNKKFVTTIILVNLLIALLIVLFLYRRKSKH